MARKLKPKPFESIDELIDAMRSMADLVPEDEGAVTVKELIDRLQWCDSRVYAMLHTMKAYGRLECIKVRREQLDGTQRRIAGYKVKL